MFLPENLEVQRPSAELEDSQKRLGSVNTAEAMLLKHSLTFCLIGLLLAPNSIHRH